MKNIKSIFLMAGGNWRSSQALVPWLLKIFEETGKSEPRIAYLGVANGDDKAFFGMLEALFKAAGAAEIDFVRLASPKADLVKAKQMVQAADAVFLSGGDVEEGMRWLKQHNWVDFLGELYKKGKLFFGLSAGSILLGRQWVKWRDPNDDNSAELFECLGLAPLICDTHAEQEGWEELKAAVQLLGSEGVGFGIPSGGVIRVAADGQLLALGKPVVAFANQAGRVIELKPSRVSFETSLE